MVNHGYMRNGKRVLFPKHRYYDELGMYDSDRQVRDALEKREYTKHPCGCETAMLPDGAVSIKPCELHKNYGYVWVAMLGEQPT